MIVKSLVFLSDGVIPKKYTGFGDDLDIAAKNKELCELIIRRT